MGIIRQIIAERREFKVEYATLRKGLLIKMNSVRSETQDVGEGRALPGTPQNPMEPHTPLTRMSNAATLENSVAVSAGFDVQFPYDSATSLLDQEKQNQGHVKLVHGRSWQHNFTFAA